MSYWALLMHDAISSSRSREVNDALGIVSGVYAALAAGVRTGSNTVPLLGLGGRYDLSFTRLALSFGNSYAWLGMSSRSIESSFWR